MVVGLFACPHYDVVAERRSQDVLCMTSIERKKTVTTVIEEPVIVRTVVVESIWTRLANGLKSMGRKIMSGLGKLWGATQRGATWLYSNKVVQWAVTKSKFLVTRAWNFLSGPFLWIAGPIAAIIFMPKFVAFLIILLVVTMIAGFFWVAKRMSEIEASERTAEEIAEEIATSKVVTWLRPSVDGSIGNGTEDILNPDETLEERYVALENLIDAAKEADAKPAVISEHFGRLHLLEVRRGLHGKLKQDASVSVIHRHARKTAEVDAPDYNWEWTRMFQGARSEDARLKKVAKLKADQANLTTV